MGRNSSDIPRRRTPIKDPIPYLLVVCEGEKTEPQYIDQFRKFVSNRLVEIDIVRSAGTPKTVVETAVLRKRTALELAENRKDSFLAFDEIWCVFDVDDHPLLPDAIQQARDNQLFVALSNPCFELWLLLHFANQSAYLSRKAAKTRLGKFYKGYNKTVDFEKLHAGYHNAVHRAKRLELERKSGGTELGNPSTNVFKLTERIREFGRKD